MPPACVADPAPLHLRDRIMCGPTASLNSLPRSDSFRLELRPAQSLATTATSSCTLTDSESRDRDRDDGGAMEPDCSWVAAGRERGRSYASSSVSASARRRHSSRTSNSPPTSSEAHVGESMSGTEGGAEAECGLASRSSSESIVQQSSQPEPEPGERSFSASTGNSSKVDTVHRAVASNRAWASDWRDSHPPLPFGNRPREHKAITLGGHKSAFNTVPSSANKAAASFSFSACASASASEDANCGSQLQDAGEQDQDQACSVVGSPEHPAAPAPVPPSAFPPKKRPFLATLSSVSATAEEQQADLAGDALSLSPPQQQHHQQQQEAVEQEEGEEDDEHCSPKPAKAPRLSPNPAQDALPRKSVNIFVDLNLSSHELVPINAHIEVCKRVASGLPWKGQQQQQSGSQEAASSSGGWTAAKPPVLGLSLASDHSGLCNTPSTSEVHAAPREDPELACIAQPEVGITSPARSKGLFRSRARDAHLSSSQVSNSTVHDSLDDGRQAWDAPRPLGGGTITRELHRAQAQHMAAAFRARARATPAQSEEEVKKSEHARLKLSLQSTAALFENPPAGMEAQGLSLVHLLLQCAEAAARDDSSLAADILGQLYQGASLYGDSMQRIAAYFAEGLAARVVGKASPVYATLMHQPSVRESLLAFTALYKVSPYFQFAHFTANQAILEAMEGEELVHVVDLDIMQGFQWPSLIQSLATRPGGPPRLLRITGVGEEGILRDTGQRLASFAASFDMAFEFDAVARDLEHVTPDCIRPRPGEAMAVNCVFKLHTLLYQPDEEGFATQSPTRSDEHYYPARLQGFLRSTVARLGPKVVTLVEQEASHNAPTFLARFVEALHYYAAIFDSLDSSLPQQSEDRVKIEQVHFATQIKNIVACEGAERVARHETAQVWQQRMKAAGFVQLPLSSHNVTQAKLLLQLCPCEGYKMSEKGGLVSLAWQDRQLLTASAWACRGRT